MLLLLVVVVCVLPFAASSVAQCSVTMQGGHHFDLSPLSRFGREADWMSVDKYGNSYYFNVCADTNEVPDECVSLEKAVHAAAYQVTNQSDCYWLGIVKSMEWEYIDELRPSSGIELYYFDGEQCEGGIPRDFRIQFFCDPDSNEGPQKMYVQEENCHYSIAWPTKYGCPVSPSKEGWVILTFLFFIVVGYIAVGCAYNIVRLGARFGPEAFPHSEFWREFPELVKEGCRFSYEKVTQFLNRQPAYETVGGENENEWG